MSAVMLVPGPRAAIFIILFPPFWDRNLGCACRKRARRQCKLQHIYQDNHMKYILCLSVTIFWLARRATEGRVLTRPPPFSLAFGERATAKVEPCAYVCNLKMQTHLYVFFLVLSSSSLILISLYLHVNFVSHSYNFLWSCPPFTARIVLKYF